MQINRLKNILFTFKYYRCLKKIYIKIQYTNEFILKKHILLNNIIT